MFKICWSNNQTTGSTWSMVIPKDNPIGSCLKGKVIDIYGDKTYRELVAECDNDDALELPKDKIEEKLYFNVLVQEMLI